MRNVFLISLLLGSVALGAGIRQFHWELPLYTSHQTWDGGRVKIQVYYDSQLGVQKRIVENR